MKAYQKNYLQDLSKKQQEFLMNKEYYSEKKLSVFSFDDSYVLPTKRLKTRKPTFYGGVVDKEGCFIKESGIYGYGTNDKVIGSYDFNKDDIEYFDEEVIYMNTFFNQWGHFIADSIPRLWYAVENKKYRIVYSCIENRDTRINENNNFGKLLALLGINEKRLICVDRKVTKFKKVIIPESSIYTGKYYTKEYQNLIDVIVNNSIKTKHDISYDKVYLSRDKFSLAKDKEINEKELEKVFLDNGYKIIYMEDYSIEEQINILNQASKIVSSSSTLAHNCIFIRNQNCDFAIINKTYRVNVLQYQINNISKANISFIDAYLAPMPVSIGRGPFWYVITKEFKEFCKDNNLNKNIEMTNITIKDLAIYYYKWFMIYKKRFINFKSIGESDLLECGIDYKDLRSHFKKNVSLFMH